MNKISGLLIGIVAGLIAGYLITSNFLVTEAIPGEYVRVTVKNKSGENITNLTLKHESGSIDIQNLSKGDSVNLIFKTDGENSYKITGTVAEGLTLTSGGTYIEPGYRTTATIFADSIKTSYDTY